jgi:uncharacterized protein with GYD domain
MPKYLIQASYTAEGVRGLQKDKASGRRQAVLNALEPLRGKLESFNFAFGGDDVVAVIDMPDNVNAAAMSLAIAASGLVRLKTTPLLTVEETDQALAKGVSYRAPGK